MGSAASVGVTVSIVSHGQGKIVSALLSDLARVKPDAKVIFTYNIPELEVDLPEVFAENAKIIWNENPKGFGANHNQAFQYCDEPYFVVVNPDIRLSDSPFEDLARLFSDDESCGICAPSVADPTGSIEDSARYFPTFGGLIKKVLLGEQGRYPVIQGTPTTVDWAGGMFLMFRADKFRAVNGFDEGYFLYYEDVDICARFWRRGWKVVYEPRARVTHDAQRASHKSIRYLRWHVSSMARYLFKHRSPMRFLFDY
ncbi:glycosyltransferase [Rhizobium sp. CRIBSB]|nr:glycosyltransferase [Rhizobium sp. CRIBSB]